MNLTRTAVGIEKIGVYPLSLRLGMETLCAARGRPHASIRDSMMIDARSVSPSWEDVVTIGVNAANDILTEADRKAIGLLIVSTESSIDEEKGASTWVHRYLRLNPHCRSFEVKAACFGGTAAMMLALAWLESPSTRPGAKALVISADQSRPHFKTPHEFALGGAGTSILLSTSPHALEIDLASASACTIEREDLIRPDPYVEVGDTELVFVSSLEALDICLDGLQELAVPWNPFADARWNLYHAPFGGMTFLGHKAMLARYTDVNKQQARAHFDAHSLPGLKFSRECGSTYSASTILGMLGLFAHEGVSAGDDVAIFAYGAGSQGEIYRGQIGAQFQQVLRTSRIGEKLAARADVSVADYEHWELARMGIVGKKDANLRHLQQNDSLYQTHYAGQGKLVLTEIKNYNRVYDWS